MAPFAIAARVTSRAATDGVRVAGLAAAVGYPLVAILFARTWLRARAALAQTLDPATPIYGAAAPCPVRVQLAS